MWMMMTTTVCCVCGDKGKIKDLIRCVECEVDVSVVHRYCKSLKEGDATGWTCGDCLEKKMMQRKVQSRKSIRVQDRWIKRSNYKAIHKPDKKYHQGGGLDNFHCSEQMKACFRSGLEGSSTDSIDHEQCHSFFMHRQCKSPQENRCPESQWTSENGMGKKSMQLSHKSSPSKKTSRMRAGWLPSKKLSDKPQKLGFHDLIFRKESGVRLLEQSKPERTGNKLINVPLQSVHSTSITQNAIQEKNEKRRKLEVDCSDIFGDDDYSTTKASRCFQNAQYRQQNLELGNYKSSDKNRSLDHGKASIKNFKAQAEIVQVTPFQHDVSNHVENRQRKKLITDYSDIFSDESHVSSKERKGFFQVVSDRPLQIGPRDGITSDKSWESDHGRASKKMIKVDTSNLLSTSSSHNNMHEKNRQRRKLITNNSEIFGKDDASVDLAATKAKKGLSQAARDRPHNYRHGIDTSLVNKRGQIEQPHELLDRSVKGAWHDVIGNKGDPVERQLEYVPAEPITNPVWRGLVCIQLAKFRTDMELFCHLSTNCSSKVAEAVKGLPNTLTFAVKCRSDIWPRRFQMSSLSDDAIALYFLPKNEKDAMAYNDMFDKLVKYKFGLLCEVPSENQNLLIFPSSLLPVEIRRLRRKTYMWGTLEDKGSE